MIRARHLILLAMLALAAACARYPLGMSEEEWLRLTPQQQHEARLADAELRRAQAAQRAREAEAAALAERNRLIDLYQRAGYGDILWCEIAPAPGSDRQYFDPDGVTLVSGESRRVGVSGSRFAFSDTGVWVTLDRFGAVELCEEDAFDDEPGFPCDRLSMGLSAFRDDRSMVIDSVDPLRGGRLTCRPYRGGPGWTGIPAHLR
ncbi:MAG: hypothetical protein RLO50_15375 [Azospirillaceae bacterium]